MDDTSGQQLAGGYRVHSEPFHPLRTQTSPNAAQGDLLAEPCNTYVQGVDQWGAPAEGSSSTNICSNATGDLDPDAEPISLAGKAQAQALGGHRRFSNGDVIILDLDGDGFDSNGEKPFQELSLGGRHRRFSNADAIILNMDGDDFDSNGEKPFQALGGRHRRFSNADVIILDMDGHGFDSNGEKLFNALGGRHRRFSNADVIIFDQDDDGFDSNGEKPFQELGGRHRRFSNSDVIILDIYGDGFDSNGEKLFQALGGRHRRFSNADVIILDMDGDGFDSNGEKLFQALGGRHRRCSNTDVITLDTDGDGFVSNGNSLSMVCFEALGGHRDCNYANAESTVNTNPDGNAFVPNGEPRSMAWFQLLDSHCGRSAELRSSWTEGELRTSSVAVEFNYYSPYASVIQSVWRDNCVGVFKRVVDKLRQPRRHLYIAIDLEYVADASTNVRFRPICWNTWYDHLRTFVNGGDMLQVGLALAFDLNYQRHGGPRASSSPVIALEMNLKFDVDAREYNDASIKFLADQGHCLAEHRDRGVTTEQFVNGLLRHLPFGNDSVTWVTYHGDRDFGFLLRLLQSEGGGALPSNRATFMRQVRQKFPVFYDVRVLGQLEKEGFTGSLTAMAAHLGVRRIGGEHHAGSDALLTLSCFKEIHHRNEHKLHRLHSRQCLLSGMEEFDMGIKCARHIDDATVITVEVRGHNFEEEARRIDELVASNFKTIGVDVQLPQLGCGIRFYAADLQQDYDLMKSSLKGIDTFQVTIGFMNAEGMLAYGRVWKFHVSSRADLAVTGGNNTYVRPGQLAWLMASCSATHNSNVTWVTYQGSLGIACLIKSFLAANDLPSDWCSYIKHQRGLFPILYDVGLIAQECPDIGKHPLGLGMLLAPQALFVLRFYKRLAESPYFPHIAEAVRGQLMASQSCFWY